MATAHIKAEKGDFAKVVLMPGDPNRAKLIAESTLHDVKVVNTVRGILAFTGYTKNNVRVSVMASGMGMPSIGIYSWELFSQFDVEAIIRVGTCGIYQENINVKDVLIVDEAITDSSWSYVQYGIHNKRAFADPYLAEEAKKIADENGIRSHKGIIYSSDVFYNAEPDYWKQFQAKGAMGVEMESYSLFLNAEHLHKKALCILTATDSFITGEHLSSEEREKGGRNMITIALALAEKLS